MPTYPKPPFTSLVLYYSAIAANFAQIINMMKKVRTAGKIAHIVIAIAAIRCVLEPLRLSWLGLPVSAQALSGYMYGALLAMVATLVMTLLTWYRKYPLNIPVSVLSLIGLVVIKSVYAL